MKRPEKNFKTFIPIKIVICRLAKNGVRLVLITRAVYAKNIEKRTNNTTLIK